jgi:Na+/H+ antiporter subunit
MTITELAVLILTAIGVFFMLVSTYGILRLPDVYTRGHVGHQLSDDRGGDLLSPLSGAHDRVGALLFYHRAHCYDNDGPRHLSHRQTGGEIAVTA